MFQATISGNLGHNPDLRHLDGGGAICKLRVAVKGRKTDPTIWMTVEVWGKPGEWAGENLGKGARIVASGRVYMNEWETKEGEKRSEYRMEASEIEAQGEWKPRDKEGEASLKDKGDAIPSIPEDDIPF